MVAEVEEFCGCCCENFHFEVAEKLIRVNDKYWGKLSFKKLAGKLKEEEGVDVSPRTICTWSKALRTIRRHRDIKPKLSSAHKISRLEFVLTKLCKDRGRWRFTDNNIVAHGVKNGSIC